ncbi:hypothetical protein FRC06_006577 [Ceratobasidium sp. 370]|nr:hypothetical protein FRC06_006577 [Ceratobasidium sp. 370]
MSTFTEEWMFAHDGMKLYTRRYIPSGATGSNGTWGASGAKAAILFVHGFIEHVGREVVLGLSGVIATSPLIRQAHPAPSWQVGAGGLVSKLPFGSSVTVPAEVKAEDLSHDPAVGAAYKADPYVKFIGTTKGIYDMLTGGKLLGDRDVTNWPPELPLLVLHGTEDNLRRLGLEFFVALESVFYPTKPGFVMSILDIPLDTILTTLGAVAFTILLPAGLSRFRRSRTAQPGQPAAQPPKGQTSRAMRTTVTLYSLLAFGFWYASQPDLFTRLRLPLTATGDQIRSALVTQRPREFIPADLQMAYDQASASGLNLRSKEPRTSHPLFTPSLDRVLQRIDTFGVRIVYGRLGHTVVESCEWCTAPEDYLMFGAAGLGLGYVALLVVVGVVTEAAERRKSRVWAVAAVAVAVALDVFCTGLVKGTLKRGESVPYHVRAERFRLLLHIFLPNFLLMLPHNTPYLTQETYMNTLQALSALSHVSAAQQNTMKHTRYAGLVRDASVSSWAEAVSRNVDGALEDEEFVAQLDAVRPEEQKEQGRPAVERLKEWAGKATSEVMEEMSAIISGMGATTGQQQGRG